jgi:hypothetical protein
VSNYAPKTGVPVAEKESAETFAESDVTVSTDADSTVSGESLAMFGGVVNYDQTGTSTYDNWTGTEFSPNVAADTVTVTIAQDTDTLTDVRVRQNTNIISSKSGSFAPGDQVTFTGLGLSAGDNYRVDGQDPNGYQYAEFGDPNVSTPNFDTVGAGNIFSTLQVGPQPTAATATVAWPMPPDVYSWDVGVYQADPGGGSVEVYVEEDQSGGWAEVAGPISRGDRLPADPANNVRYRVEFSKPGGAKTPKLDAIYRRRKL